MAASVKVRVRSNSHNIALSIERIVKLEGLRSNMNDIYSFNSAATVDVGITGRNSGWTE